MDTLPRPRNPAWRHGLRLAGARDGLRPATGARRPVAAALGAARGLCRGRYRPPARCRSLPRLAFGPL